MIRQKMWLAGVVMLNTGCCPSLVGPASAGGNREPSAVIQQQLDGLELTAIALNEGWPPKVKLTVANRSSLPIWLSGRFAVGQQGSLFEEVWFDVVKGQSRPEAVSCRSGAGRPRSSDYVFLPPGAELSHVVVLSCVPFVESGPWTIVAHYHDRNPQPPAPPPAAHWFAGELSSPPAEIAARPSEPPIGSKD
jgi:hypothetical protein